MRRCCESCCFGNRLLRGGEASFHFVDGVHGVGFVFERERAVRALAESEARFRSVVESAHDAIVITKRGVITYDVAIKRSNNPEGLQQLIDKGMKDPK